MKLPGLGRFRIFISKLIGRKNKYLFSIFIFSDNFKKIINVINEKEKNNLELVTFSNSNSFLDLILSILSFVNSNGIPKKWTIYQDDDFTCEQLQLLNKLNFVEYKPWNLFYNEKPNKDLESNWQFKKYISFSRHPFNQTTIFLDSDIIFYSKFNYYINFFSKKNWYLLDPSDACSIDKELLSWYNYESDSYIINSGFIILNSALQWNLGLEYIYDCNLRNKITHFSEQSSINLLYCNDINSKVLDPRFFLVTAVDQFRLKSIDTKNLAIRHYVGPVRHKMWQLGWKNLIK